MKTSALLLSLLLFSLAVLPLQKKWQWKTALFFLILLAGFKSQILYKLGGTPFFFGPDVPGWLIASGGWIYGTFILYLLMMLPAGIVRLFWILILKLRKKPVTKVFRKRWNIAHALLLTLAVLASSIGLRRGTMLPEIRDVAIEITGKQPASPLKIVLLADLHADRMTRADKIRAFVERANAAGGDVIVLAGDLIDGCNVYQELLPLKELHAPFGVYAVPGNHEYYNGYEEWKNFFAAEFPRIRLLENQSVTLPDGTVLAGVADPAAQRGSRKFAPPDIAGALQGTPANARKILLAHQPRLAYGGAANGIDLQLSGHTHGGMVIGLDQFVKHANGNFVSGLYEVGNMKLYVSNGTGIWNGFPIRLGHDPEITRITISGK